MGELSLGARVAALIRIWGWLRLYLMAPSFLLCEVEPVRRFSGVGRLQGVGAVLWICIATSPLFLMWDWFFPLSLMAYMFSILLLLIVALGVLAARGYEMSEDAASLRERGIWFPSFMAGGVGRRLLWALIFVLGQIALIIFLLEVWWVNLEFM